MYSAMRLEGGGLFARRPRHPRLHARRAARLAAARSLNVRSGRWQDCASFDKSSPRWC